MEWIRRRDRFLLYKDFLVILSDTLRNRMRAHALKKFIPASKTEVSWKMSSLYHTRFLLGSLLGSYSVNTRFLLGSYSPRPLLK
jgi:hypothetical protein